MESYSHLEIISKDEMVSCIAADLDMSLGSRGCY